MKYIIMCGGEYEKFKTPKHLSVVNGERLADRTIRLLRENGVDDIAISSNNPMFDSCGVPRLEHTNTFKLNKDGQEGYWLDAYYPVQEPVCYIYGDVYFSDEAIATIVRYKKKNNTLFGTSIARNGLHENWGEPFAYKVYDYEAFFKGIEDVKRLQDEGKCDRLPVTWELYRYLNGLDINVQQITDNYVDIDDITMDIDNPKDIAMMNEKASGN